MIPDPYRPLFPIGILIGVGGACLWLLFFWGTIGFYPRYAHANLMFFGFMWAFVAGFLMTAVPKMTRTSHASFFEIGFALLITLTQVFFNIIDNNDISVLIFSVQIFFLIIFFGRRFKKNRVVPFPGFIFLPAAFSQGLLGVLVYYFSANREAVVLLSGEAFLMNLIVGLGSRLIPVISRLPNAIPPAEVSRESYSLPLTVLLLINLGYLVQVFTRSDSGIYVRTIGLIMAAIYLARVFHRPTVWSASGVSLKVGFLLIILGQLLSLQELGWTIAARHLTYIGGFTLITLMVSTRVTLAHGGQELNYEIDSKSLVAMLVLLVSSAAFRYVAGSDVMSPLVTTSIILFCMALGLWIRKFISVQMQAGRSEL